jgi:phage-related protein
MAKNNKQSINELKEVQGLTSSIGKLTDQLVQKSDKRNKSLANEANTLKSIVSNIKSTEEFESKIVELQKRKLQITQTNFGVNEKYKDDLLKIYETSIKILDLEEKRKDIIGKIDKNVDNVASSLNQSLDSFKNKLSEIPVLGNVFEKLIPFEFLKKRINDIGDNFKKSFKDAYSTVNGQGKGFVRSLSSGLSSGLRTAFANPLMLALSLFAMVAAAGVLAFYKISEAAKQFRQETGLLRSQTRNLEGNIKSVYLATVGLGASMEDVAQSAAAFTKQFKNLEQPSQRTLTSIVALSKNFGVLPETAAQVTKLVRDMTGASADQSQYFTNQVALLSKMAGVAPNQVMQDIAESSEDALKYFGGSQKQLKWGAIYAARMGTSIKKMSESARGLLDFETSITDQMQASAILGRNLNLNQARYFAMTGNTVKMHEAIGKEVDKLGDLTRLNVFQQEALAKATGVPFQDLVEQQRIRQRFGKLDEKQMKALEAQIKAGKEIKDITKEDLNQQAAVIAATQEMQSEFDQLVNKIKEFGMKFLLSLEPVGRTIMNIVPHVIKFGNVLMTTLQPAFNNLKDGAMAIIEPLQRMFGTVESKFGVAETLAKVFGGAFSFILNTVGVLFKGIGNFITAFEKFGKGDILGGIKDALLGTLRVFVPGWKWIEGGIKTAMDMFPEFGEKVNAVIEKVKSAFDTFTSWFKFGKKGEEEFQTVEKAGMNFMQMLLIGGVALGVFGRKLKGLFSSFNPFKKVNTEIGQVGKSSTSVLSKIGKGVGDLGSGIGRFISGLSKGISTALGSLGTGIGTFINGLSTGIGKALSAIGKGLGGFFRGMSGGLASLANPAALIGLAAIVAGIFGIAVALRIAGPALEPFGKMMKSVFEGIATVVVPIIETLSNTLIKLAGIVGTVIITVFKEFSNIINVVGDNVKKVFESIGSVVQPIIDSIVNGVVKIAQIVSDTMIGTLQQLGVTLEVLLKNVSMEKVGAIALLGGALVSLSGGLMALSGGNVISSIIDGFGKLFGAQSPIRKIETLAQYADKIALLAFGMDIFAKSISTVVSSMKDLDIDKFEDFAEASGGALKDMFRGATLQVQPASMEVASGMQQQSLVTTQIISTNERIISKLEEVKQAVLSGGTIYMDGEKVSASVTRNQNQRRSNTGTDMRTL